MLANPRKHEALPSNVACRPSNFTDPHCRFACRPSTFHHLLFPPYLPTLEDPERRPALHLPTLDPPHAGPLPRFHTLERAPIPLAWRLPTPPLPPPGKLAFLAIESLPCPTQLHASQSHPLASASLCKKSLPELSAIPIERLLTINIDVTTAITTVMGALPRLRSIHAEMQARWRDCDVQQLERLERYALALQHLFVRAYEEARRAVLYLRAKAGDGVAPSLYAVRGSRRRAAEAELDLTPTAPVTAAGAAGSPPPPAPSDTLGLEQGPC